MKASNNPLSQAFDKADDIAPFDEKKMSSRSYLVVAIVGLLVTALSFFALSELSRVLIDQRIDGLSDRAIGTYKYFLQVTMDDFDQVASKVEQLSDGELSAVKENKAASIILDDVRPFNFLALSEPSQGAGNIYLLDRKVDKPDLKTLQAVVLSKDEFIKNLRDNYNGTFDTQLVIHHDLMASLNHISPQTSDSKLVLLKRVRGNSWLIAEEPVGALVEREFIALNDGVASLSIRQQSGGIEIHSYVNDEQAYEEGRLFPKIEKNISIGGLSFVVSTVLIKDMLFNVFLNMPYLGLAIGLITSIIMTLHSLSKAQQEKRIRIINHVLEQKNKALEDEVTKRQKLHDELEKTEADNVTLLNSIKDIIFEIDAKGDFTFLNAAWFAATGYEVSQSLGRNLFNAIKPDEYDTEKSKFESFLSGGEKSYVSKTSLRTIDGTFNAIELNISMTRRDENGSLRVVGRISDLEEKQRAASALIEAEKKYQGIVRNAAWGLYQMSPEGIYISANPAMARTLGYHSEDEAMESIFNAFDSVYENSAEQRSFLKDLSKTDTSAAHEIQMKTKQGHLIWIQEHVRAVKDENGNVIYYEGSVENINKRKEADVLLHEAKTNSDAANRAKTEFLANMSHELRTPLNAIIGFSEIITNETLGPLGHESYKEYSNEINKGGQHLLQIINEILEISKIEVNKRELNESQLRIEDILEYGIKRFAEKAESNGVSIINKVENTNMVVAEERALKQVFSNIISNAVKFTPQGGSLTIAAEMAENGGINISFADTGVGLDVEEIKKALSPFGQVGASFDQHNAGTGLGLTLVKALVELHDGRLDVFSQKGMGTTVTVHLPASRVIRQSA